MENQIKSTAYQQAVTLAEAGQHQQALQVIRMYLQTNPNDPEALNDAGTILFCMNRGSEAIEMLEKAKTLAKGDLLSQILWNLCEAYLQEDRPAEAALLFDLMAENKILNIEILNRAANVFLQREALGGAMECLLRSLSEQSQQEVLRPIVEVIRSKRPAAALLAENLTPMVQDIYEWLNQRFRTELILAGQHQMPGQAGLTIAVGVGQTLRQFTSQKQTSPTVLILSAEDVHHPDLERIHFQHINQVLVCGTSSQIETLIGRIPNIHKITQLEVIDEPLDLHNWSFVTRGQGKKLAAIGPFNAYHNPAYLLQCMQKLNYLDRDYRLYLAGGFEDRAAEQYCRYMIHRLNLDGVVIVENTVGNLSGWLKDKHYIVHASATAGGIRSVWAAMASGLKPVIGAFAGCDEVMDSRYIFGIAEEFCAQVQENDYQPHAYRHWIEQRVSKQGFFKSLYVALSKIERQLTLQSAPKTQTAAPIAAQQQTPFTPVQPFIPPATTFAPRPVIDTAPKAAPSANAPMPWQPPVQPVPQPLRPMPQPQPQMPLPSQNTAPASGKSISQVAEEALKASRRLREMITSADQQANAKPEDAFSVPFVR